jgi:hypothetical protein
MIRRSSQLVLSACLLLAGCHVVEKHGHQPQVFNPFPQMSRVAVAPFFNLSDEPTVDGREFAIAYFNELQAVPGFEVLPLSVTEVAIRQHGIRLDKPGEARRLAQILNVDAVVIGGVTEFTPYYPPECGLQVEWWAANPAFQEVPPGFGLPWGTPEEEFIPPRLVYESEKALAAERLADETPAYQKDIMLSVPRLPKGHLLPAPGQTLQPAPGDGASNAHAESIAIVGALGTAGTSGPVIDCGVAWQTNDGPVLRQTAVYHGNSADFVTALDNHLFFIDDERIGGSAAYLQRSDDFIRFCCHLHIFEMLSARGGAGKTRVVWRRLHGR